MDQLLDISTWIPTTVLVILVFLGRNLIKTRLSASVQHEYNAKLKALESELRTTEKSLAADIEAEPGQQAHDNEGKGYSLSF